MRAAPIGPWKGAGLSAKAAEAPITDSTSGSFCWSLERTRHWIWTSFRKSSGNSGRIGRSISRMVRISFVEGLPSRLKNPPGTLPAAYWFSR